MEQKENELLIALIIWSISFIGLTVLGCLIVDYVQM